MTGQDLPPARPGSSSASATEPSSAPPSAPGWTPYDADLMTPEEGQAMLDRFLAAGRRAEAHFRARKAAQAAE